MKRWAGGKRAHLHAFIALPDPSHALATERVPEKDKAFDGAVI